jgi:uncharacterized damage-inducible protein DinB
MNSAESLASEVRRSVSGETWFGPSLAEVLAGVDAGRAATRVDAVPHSIWELVTHVAVWARYSAYRFGGGVPRELDEANWPPVTDATEIAWAAAQADALDACQRAADSLAALTDEALVGVDDTTPTDAMGDPVTLSRIASGLAQHVAYHAGQIALIKQLLAPRGAPA